MEGFISTYRFGGVIESGRSGRDSWTHLTSAAKTLRPLPKGHSHTQPSQDYNFLRYYFSHSPVIPLSSFDLEISKLRFFLVTLSRCSEKYSAACLRKSVVAENDQGVLGRDSSALVELNQAQDCFLKFAVGSHEKTVNY